MFTTISAFEFWGRGTGQLPKLLKFDHQRAFISFREKTQREREEREREREPIWQRQKQKTHRTKRERERMHRAQTKTENP